MVASIFASQQPSFQDFLGATYLSPLSSPPADWGTVSYAYVTGSYIGNNGDPVVNAKFRHVIVPVASYWQGVRVAGAYRSEEHRVGKEVVSQGRYRWGAEA